MSRGENEVKAIEDYGWHNPVLTRKEVRDVVERVFPIHEEKEKYRDIILKQVQSLAFTKASEEMDRAADMFATPSTRSGKWVAMRTPTREEETELLKLRAWLFRHFMETGKYPTPRHCLGHAWKFAQQIFDYGNADPLRQP